MSDTREGQDLVKPKLDIFGAAEGQELDLLGTDTADQQRIHGSGNATAPAVVTGSILIAVRDPVAAGTIREAAKADGISLLELGSAKEVFAAVDAFQPPVVILEYESAVQIVLSNMSRVWDAVPPARHCLLLRTRRISYRDLK